MFPRHATGLVWFRRDLRAHDNAALHHALETCAEVHCAFVFDRAILDLLPRQDRRVTFIRESVAMLDEDLRRLAGLREAGLVTVHGVAALEIPKLALDLGVQAVFANHDDEPLALERDAQVRDALARARVAFHTSKDHVIFERRELMTRAGAPYSVFTPYRNAWLAKLDDFHLVAHPVEQFAAALAERPAPLRRAVPTLAELGFEPADLHLLGVEPGVAGGERCLAQFLPRIGDYGRARDFPALPGTSSLGVHLRFGTVSVRELARTAHRLAAGGSEGAATWLSELAWRDFFVQVLSNFPHVAGEDHRGASFRPQYDAIQWEDGPRAEAHFAAWCEGRTGYPIVDAAMAQINATGTMHNRLRMVVASFLCKDLGIDWRRGAAYFARNLLDYDLASNNGNWQWAASTGCDAQPWFRIFNPVSQSRKFDAQGAFIRKWLPQLAPLSDAAIHAPWEAQPLELAAAGISLGVNYPLPIVDHAAARERTLRRYEAVKP